MPSFLEVIVCAVLAAAFWMTIGLALTIFLVPRRISFALAPVCGWAFHSVVVLPIFIFFGTSRAMVVFVVIASSIAAIISLYVHRDRLSFPKGQKAVIFAFAGAAFVALAIMAAIVPKMTADGVTLAAPIFDHSKVAIVDEISRLGVPPANPFFGEVGGPAHLAYYYLWHFSAAELSLVTGSGGWAADAALTWFTAFGSLSLMIGLAVWLSGQSSSAVWVVLLAATASIRPILALIFGDFATNAVTGWATGFGGWLFQSQWAPQHLASANSAVLAVFLLSRLALAPGVFGFFVFSTLTAASFQSSIWIGGVTFPLAVALVASLLLVKLESSSLRLRFSAGAMIAAAIAVAFSFPMLRDVLLFGTGRDGALPIAISPYDILGDETPESVRRLLDVPVFWLVFLVVELPAYYLAGAVFTTMFVRDRRQPRNRKIVIQAFSLAMIASLAVSALIASRLAVNNDLGWRSVLPAIILLIVFSAAGLSTYVRKKISGAIVLQFAAVALSLFTGLHMMYHNFVVGPSKSGATFLRSADMWEAVRRHSARDDRIANNPDFVADMTIWPINISWALMANRRSCYAGPDFILPFSKLNAVDRDALEKLFVRVFSGRPEDDDIRKMVERYNCSLAVVVVTDGAWTSDPFSSSPIFHLAETQEGSWRVYKAQPR